MTTAIVYVQLGENPAKTLYQFACQARKILPQSKVFLLTDKPELWHDFPGEIVDVSLRTLDSGFASFRNRNKELERIAGGYWLNTVKRLFVLQVMQDVSNEWEDLLHFESDVFSFLSEEIIECLRAKVDTVAVPRFSESRGIASVVYVRSQSALNQMTKDLSEILVLNPIIRDDMELLGAALETGAVSELPSLPDDGWQWNGKTYVFDGAAYGQFLFGQDPFHTQGYIVSGFQNPNFDFEVSSVSWRLENQHIRGAQLKFNVNEEDYVLANIHIHSKIQLPEPSLSDPLWRQYLSEANNQSHRIPIATAEISVHSKKLNLRTRIQIARKNGLRRTIIKKLYKTFRF